MTKREKIIAASAAIIALVLHYQVSPHGQRLDSRLGSEVTLIKTTEGWVVHDGDTVYQAKEVRIDADHLD